MADEPIELTLKEKRHEYGAVYTFVFEPSALVDFGAGQYVHIRLPMLAREERPVRELSFASPPEEVDLMFTVNTRSNSPFQEAIRALAPGEKVLLFKVRGEMTVPEDGQNLVLIAHGVGMAPFRSILQHLSRSGRKNDTVLVQIDREHFLYHEELSALPYEQHRITREQVDTTLMDVVRSHQGARYCAAGSPAFVQDIVAKLANLGISAEQIKADEFEGLEE